MAFTNAVVREAPFQLTTAPLMKLEPFTVRVNCAPPTTALAGERPVIIGGRTENGAEFDVRPPWETVTCAVPEAAISAALMVAVKDVELPNTVVREPPFHFTVAPLTKPVPVTVKVNPAVPATALLGERLVIAGVGTLIVNVAAADGPDVGCGFVTVT